MEKGAETATQWYQKAIPALTEDAIKGDPAAQLRLAMSYFTGIGVESDSLEGQKWLLSSVKQKYLPALTYLGRASLEGFGGITKDEGRGIEVLRESANRQDEVAQVLLGEVYYAGKVVPHDYKKAAGIF